MLTYLIGPSVQLLKTFFKIYPSTRGFSLYFSSRKRLLDSLSPLRGSFSLSPKKFQEKPLGLGYLKKSEPVSNFRRCCVEASISGKFRVFSILHLYVVWVSLSFCNVHTEFREISQKNSVHQRCSKTLHKPAIL